MIDMKHMNHAMRATSEMDFVQLHLVDRLNPPWMYVIGSKGISSDLPDQQFEMKLDEVSSQHSHPKECTGTT